MSPLLRLEQRTFASLHASRNYRLFFAGQVVSQIGTWMQNVALAWLVLRLTGDPFAVGVLALAQFLPFTLLGLFAGVVVDRFDARRTVIVTQALAMVHAVGLAALVLAGLAAPWHLYVLAAARGVILLVDLPSRQTLTFEMVGRDALPNAVALNSSLLNGARVVGPALGGVLLAFTSAGVCFAINAVSFVAVLGGLFLMRADELHALARAQRPRILAGTLEALRYAHGNLRVRLVLASVVVFSTLAFNFNVVLPVLAKDTLRSGPETYGTIFACFGAGALVGALLSASLGRTSWVVFVLAGAGMGAAELVLAPMRSVAAASVLLFALGVCFTLWTSTANSTLQLRAPEQLRGRIVGLYFYAFNGAAPLGGLLVGWLCSRGGTELSFAVAGAAGLAMTAYCATQLRVDKVLTKRFGSLFLPGTRG